MVPLEEEELRGWWMCRLCSVGVVSGGCVNGEGRLERGERRTKRCLLVSRERTMLDAGVTVALVRPYEVSRWKSTVS